MQEAATTRFHAKYFAHELTKRCASDSIQKLAASLADAQVDLNPHQIDAALFAFRFRDEAIVMSDPTNIKRYLFGGFSKCLYELQKFDVDSERRFSVILEDDGDVLKWFKPARSQFQIYYNKDSGYEPDFVVEAKSGLFLCEPKRADQMQNPEVSAKKDAAVEWCKYATEHAQEHGGKKWQYLLIPHDAITANMTLDGLASRYGIG